jgi:hypothetical protein
MWTEITDSVTAFVRSDPTLRARVTELEARVASGELAPTSAAAEVLSHLLPPGSLDDLS